jgi:hypothetical protein
MVRSSAVITTCGSWRPGWVEGRKGRGGNTAEEMRADASVLRPEPAGCLELMDNGKLTVSLQDVCSLLR